MALQHLGILWIIYEFSTPQEPMTTARLKALTKVTSTAVIKYTERLERLGLIKRKRVTASHGKGRAWEYHPALPDALLGDVVRGILESGASFPSLASLAEKDSVSSQATALTALTQEPDQGEKRGRKGTRKTKRAPRKSKPG
nr:winged helix DNA-binding protein [Microvirga tunisiensis]